MDNEIFKYIGEKSKKSLEADPPILIITKEMIQRFAQENYERRLTDAELSKIATESFNADEFCWKMDEFIDVVVCYVLGED